MISASLRTISSSSGFESAILTLGAAATCSSVGISKVKEKSQNSPKFKEIKEMEVGIPGWLSVDREKLEGTVLAEPTRDQIDTPIEEHLIVELYSK